MSFVFPQLTLQYCYEIMSFYKTMWNYLPNYCTLFDYHLVNSKAHDKSWTIKWQSLLPYLEVEWELHHSRVTSFGGICTCWQLVSFVDESDLLCFMWTSINISLEQCPKGKSSKSYFPCETDKIIHEAEEKIENEFHDEENDARLPNSKPHKFQTKWLNEHKWLK